MIPPLVLRIYADSSGVKKGVTQAQTQVGGLRASVAKNAGLIKMAIGAAFVGGVAVAVKAASDLGEAQNKSNVIFGKSAGLINEFADSADTGFGLAKAEALSAAGAFGAMFDSAGLVTQEAARMSVKMTGLAGDMASFNNESPVEMLDKLRSGLAGEAEPLRRFGVFISEARVQTEAYASGIAKAGEELTDAQKIQARYNIILQDTKKQQGDFGRTAGTSLPNQLRKLRAQFINLAAGLGKVLLPALTTLLQKVNDLIGPFIELGDLISRNLVSNEKNAESFNKLGDAVRAGKISLEDSIAVWQKLAQVQDFSLEKFEQGVLLLQGVDFETKKYKKTLFDFLPFLKNTGTEGSAMFRRIHTAAKRFYRMTTDEQKEWAAATAENFDAVQAAFDNLAGKAKLTADKIIREFNRQATNIANYRNNLQTVASRNIPDVLLQQLIDLGIGGAGIMAQLATASDKKFAAIVASMQGARGQTNGLRSDLAKLRREAEHDIIVNFRFQTFGNPDPRQRQHGGPVHMGEPYIVGERGPELFVPNRSGTVVPNDKLSSGGMGVTIHVHGDVNDADRFAQKVEAAVNRAASRH